MKDRLAEKQFAIRRPDEIVKSVVRILRTVSRRDELTGIRLVIAVGIAKQTEMRLLRNVDSISVDFERKRNVHVIRPYRRLVGFSVLIGVLEDHDLVARLGAGVGMRIRGRATDPEPSLRVPTHLDRTGNLRKFLLAREKIDLETRIDSECFQLVGWRKPLVGPFRLDHRTQRREVRVVDRLVGDVFALGKSPHAFLAILREDLIVSHGGKEVEIAVLLRAPPRIVKRVQGTVATEELLVLVDHDFAEFVVRVRRRGVEDCAEKQIGENAVSLVIEMHTVDRQRKFFGSHRSLRRTEDIREADFLFRRDFPHRLHVWPEAVIVQIGRGNVFDVFVRDGRYQHDARTGFSVESARLQIDQPGRESGFERIYRVLAGEALVVAERRENYIDLLTCKVLIHRREIVRTRLQIDLIGGPREIPDHEIRPGMCRIKIGLEPPEMLRAVEQSISDKGDAIAFSQRQRQLRLDRLGFFRSRRLFRVDPVFREAGISLRVGDVERYMFCILVVLLPGVATGFLGRHSCAGLVAGLTFRGGNLFLSFLRNEKRE